MRHIYDPKLPDEVTNDGGMMYLMFLGFGL
jgi:hypothetical protein